jgi:hypothetical protein
VIISAGCWNTRVLHGAALLHDHPLKILVHINPRLDGSSEGSCRLRKTFAGEKLGGKSGPHLIEWFALVFPRQPPLKDQTMISFYRDSLVD